MNAHEDANVQSHIDFLKDFPELNGWLNCNGFTLVHAHNDSRMQVTYTFWDDHTSEAEITGCNDAQNSLIVAYCRSCKTVEVSERIMLVTADTEKMMVGQLIGPAPAIEDNAPEIDSHHETIDCQPLSLEEIDRMIEDVGRP